MKTQPSIRNSRFPRVILGTACIPWTPGYRLDERAFCTELRHLVRSGIRHIYLFGTAGEGYALTDAQFESVAARFVREMDDLARAFKCRLYPMAGVISLSTTTILERIGRLRDLGIQDIQISLPSWGALTERELFTFFHQVCDAFPDCRFLHYNLMRTKRLVTPDEYARLAGEIPNLVATKNGNTDIVYLSGLMRKAPVLRHFITEIGFAYASLVGQPGLLISLGCTNLQRAGQFFQAALHRDAKTVLGMQAEFITMLQALMTATEHRPFIDGAYDKLFCRMHEGRFPLRLLPPYESTTPEMFRRFVAALRRQLPQWIGEDGGR